MMKRLIAILLLMLITLPALAEVEVMGGTDDAFDLTQLEELKAEVWESYRQEQLSDPQLLRETREQAMTYGDATMRYTVDIYGDKPEDGYPLYICLHGGGENPTPDVNDSQWEMMRYYYALEMTNCVYVAVRGVRDTWDTHFNPESYLLYDRLIRYMILTRDVDPNRVYLLGFSAGGDGVYAISTRMPDRFAAANMGSGHPNGVSMLNLYNLPIQLQAGEYDDAFDRNRVTAEYGLLLDTYQEETGGYPHRTLIHYDCGHNYDDSFSAPIPVMTDISAWLNDGDRTHEDVDSYPPHYTEQFTRDPCPVNLIWDLSTRAPLRETESFYYLSAPAETDNGIIAVSSDGENRFSIEAQDVNGEFSMFLNEYMVDFTQPVTFVVNGAEYTVDLEPSYAVLEATTYDRGDPNYQFEAMVTFNDF